MPDATYVQPDGTRQTLDVAIGRSLMQAAIDQGVDGIVAECGGAAMCATCHVYVDEADLARLPEIRDDEEAMLDSTAAERKPNSRLSCQLKMSPTLAGITVHIPDRQI